MSEINITKDCKLIKVLAAQAKRERVDSNVVDEANQIISELATDLTPANRHQIAQTIAYTVNDLQQHDLDFLGLIADQKNVAYGDKAAFNVRVGHIKAFYQSKGATTARSMVGSKQIIVDTNEISARPAINLMELRTGRVNMADLIREANTQMTNAKLARVENVLTTAMTSRSTPFYATGSGIVKSSFDAIINYMRRLGPVTIIGDIASVGKIAELTGFQAATGTKTFSDAIINEQNDNGYIGVYNGCNVVSLTNAYKIGTTNTVLRDDLLYIVPGGMTGDARNLKIVNEGTVQATDSQNIDDLVYEIRLDHWFGAAFCVADFPTIGLYDVN